MFARNQRPRRLATSKTCLLWIPYQLGEGFVLETRFLFICGVKAGNITVNVHKYKRKFVVVVVCRQKINNQSSLVSSFSILSNRVLAKPSAVLCFLACYRSVLLYVWCITTWIGLLPSSTTAGGLFFETI